MKQLMMCLVVTLVVGLGGDALANTKKAKAAFKKGQLHYKLGRFPEALEEFSKAYEHQPLAAFLFNIGQCHRQLGNHERAVFFFEGYLRESPEAKNRQLVEDLIAESRADLKKEAERKRLEEEKRLAEEEAKRKDSELKQKEEELRLVALEAKQSTERVDAMPLAPLDGTGTMASVQGAPEASPFYTEWWFWSAVGGVVVVGVVAGILAASGDKVVEREPASSLGIVDATDTALRAGGFSW